MNRQDFSYIFGIISVSVIAIVLCLYVFIPSKSSGSQSQKEEPFWEGVIKPGTYYISWRETSAYGENANKVSLEISIFDNREYEIREKTECGLERVYRSDTRLREGTMGKKSEIYNGKQVVWFTFPNSGDSYSVTPSGDFYRGCFPHWQAYVESLPVGKIY